MSQQARCRRAWKKWTSSKHVCKNAQLSRSAKPAVKPEEAHDLAWRKFKPVAKTIEKQRIAEAVKRIHRSRRESFVEG
jgi:hypothetical protein